MEAIFFPRNDYPNNIEVCSHRYGCSMAYTEQTDDLKNTSPDTPYTWIVPYAKSKNIKVGGFVNVNKGQISPMNGLKEDYDNGYIWLDAYSLTPNLAEYIRPTGSHYGEDITQEMWNEAYNNYILPIFYNFTGVKPIALSYSYGKDTFKNYILQFLGARNSNNNGNTNYGVGFGSPNNIPYTWQSYNSCESTTRWYNAEKIKPTQDWAAAILAQGNLIDATKLNGGWINNFTHWHDVVSDGRQEIYEDYIDMLAQKNVNNEIWFCGYGEALSYLVYRQIITKAVMYSPNSDATNKLVIRLETINNLGIDADLLQVPISVKFSTIGTPLAGQTIKSNCNLISLGSGQYIVEIPYAKYPGAVIEKVSI